MTLTWQTERPTVPGWWLAWYASRHVVAMELIVRHMDGVMVRADTNSDRNFKTVLAWAGPVETPAAVMAAVKYPPHRAQHSVMEGTERTEGTARAAMTAEQHQAYPRGRWT